MRKQDVLGILESCRKELQKMSIEEFVQRKVEQGLINKVYETSVYTDEMIEPFLFDENLKSEFALSFQLNFSDTMEIAPIRHEKCRVGIKAADIQGKQTPFAA